MKNILISFSGGRTSAFMTKFLFNNKKYEDYYKLVVFANTGKENPKTLDFIRDFEYYENIKIHWIEAKINHVKGVGTSFTKTTYETASRHGEPFKEMVKAYGIPNRNAPHCTRELKQVPIHKFAKHKFGGKKYLTAIGIRPDEKHRLNHKAIQKGIIYPLIDLQGCNAEFIRTYWASQHYNLGIKDYEGNCDLCFKKSIRKKKTIIRENPGIADWWVDMETQYGEGYKFDQRTGLTMPELVSKAINEKFSPQLDWGEKKALMPEFNFNEDYETGCFCKAT